MLVGIGTQLLEKSLQNRINNKRRTRRAVHQQSGDALTPRPPEYHRKSGDSGENRQTDHEQFFHGTSLLTKNLPSYFGILLLAQTNGFGGNFHQFVIIDIGNAVFQAHGRPAG